MNREARARGSGGQNGLSSIFLLPEKAGTRPQSPESVFKETKKIEGDKIVLSTGKVNISLEPVAVTENIEIVELY